MKTSIKNKEELKINENLNIKLISYDDGNEGSPYRMLSNKKEFVVLDSNNFCALHGVENEDGNIRITYMYSNLELTISKDVILIENSRDE